ncbi:MAG TPA: hypothetical protein ENK31_03240 [Nannocystis exedens]|nr:hypothetical protein [Nannocystis exedens]
MPLLSSFRTVVALAFALALAPSCKGGEQADNRQEADQEKPAGRAPAEAKKDGKLFAEIAAPLEFRDPDPGPRAPVTRAFGGELGRSTYETIKAMVEAQGLTCKDTSIRAMMEAKRAKAKAEQAKKGTDAVSSASLNKKSKREKNPQVRFSCPSVTSDQLNDRNRPRSRGRLLFVFDSDKHPLRHVSYQRSHANHTAALDDYEDSVKAMTELYGEPTSTRGEPPKRDKDGTATFPPSRSLELRWDFSDLSIRVTAIHFGRKVTVGERIEVPHGIRPDAPALGKPAADSAAPPKTAASAQKAPAPAPKATKQAKMSAKDRAELDRKRAASAAKP